MPPSDRQLMSIGASEHRAFVRAKARFAGPNGSETHFVRRNAVIPDIFAMYRWRHFLAESAARALPFPTSQRPTCPFSFAPGGTPPAPYGPPRHPPLPGVSRFRRIGSHLRRVTRYPARHYGSGRPGTGSLLRCFCVEQEASRSRCAFKTGNQLCENSEIQSC